MPSRFPFSSRRAVITTVLGLTVAVLLVTVAVPWWTTAHLRSALRARFFQQDPGMQAVQAAHLVQNLDLQQTTHDVTITLHQVYADEHRLILGLTTSHPQAQYLAAVREVKLGTVTGLNDVVFETWPLYHEDCGWNTVSRPICSETGTRFVVHMHDHTAALAALQAEAVDNQTPLTVDLHVVVQAELQRTVAQPHQDVASVVGPFRFDLRVPVNRAQRVKVHQTTHTAGVTVTLASMAMTPSMTRVQLCFDPLDQGTAWTPNVTIVASTELLLENGGGAFSEQPDCFTAQGYGIGDDPSGRWTVTVTELEGKMRTIPGPWSFEVMIP